MRLLSKSALVPSARQLLEEGVEISLWQYEEINVQSKSAQSLKSEDPDLIAIELDALLAKAENRIVQLQSENDQLKQANARLVQLNKKYQNESEHLKKDIEDMKSSEEVTRKEIQKMLLYRNNSGSVSTESLYQDAMQLMQSIGRYNALATRIKSSTARKKVFISIQNQDARLDVSWDRINQNTVENCRAIGKARPV